MLALTRKLGEEIHIGDEIVVKILNRGHGTVRVGIDAPRSVRISRGGTTRSEFRNSEQPPVKIPIWFVDSGLYFTDRHCAQVAALRMSEIRNGAPVAITVRFIEPIVGQHVETVSCTSEEFPSRRRQLRKCD